MPGIWGEVVAIIRRYPVAAVAPGAVLGAAAACMQFLDGSLPEVLIAGLGLVIVFELYVAYLERLVDEYDRGAARVSIAGLLRGGAPLVPALLGASLIGVTLPLAAGGLLVLPGLWLVTRWALFSPIISNEGAGPVASIRRSNELVRGHFWPVFGTVTVALLIEQAVIQGAALTAEPLLGSQLLALVGAGLVVAVISPPAALCISIVYDRLADAARQQDPAV